MVLGLGVARMLMGLIAVFRSRRRATADWLPLAWAAGIFLTQMQYWWAVNGLPHIVDAWTFENFLVLIAFTGLLFISGALLLPPTEMAEGESLREFFETDGRWALLFLSIYFACTLIINTVYFAVDLWEVWALLNLVAMALPLVVFFSRSRTVQVGTTLVAIPFCVVDLIVVTDDAFQSFVQFPFGSRP